MLLKKFLNPLISRIYDWVPIFTFIILEIPEFTQPAGRCIQAHGESTTQKGVQGCSDKPWAQGAPLGIVSSW